MTATIGVVAEEMAALESRRGLVAAELGACESELRELRGEKAGQVSGYRLGKLALDAVLGDEEAAAEIAERGRRERYLEERIALCEAAIAHADERLDGLRRTWLTGAQVREMPLEEIPEVLRERVRAAREREEAARG